MSQPYVTPTSPAAGALISADRPLADSYRPDLDGLRALAILPVLLFHAQFDAFSGGFIGVDVFFVVSGFLITSLIQREIVAGKFTYLQFWERRARRLLPPIFAVTFVSCILAYSLFLPDDLKWFGQSIVAMSAFLSNVYFWFKAGYFAAPESTVPMLHTWSLAVEEQFYFLFPAILIAVRAWTKERRILLIAAIGVASFALCVWMIAKAPEGAYYLLPTRAWELMLGASLALQPFRVRLPSWTTDTLFVAGLAMILIPVFIYDKSTPFPGFAALLPCLGTALLIWIGEQPATRLRYLLTNRATLYVGLRSYALYLWHWPLLVFWATWSNRQLGAIPGIEAAAVLALSFVCASLSLNFVENPIRRRRVLASRRSIFIFCGVCSAGLMVFGLSAHLSQGFPERVPEAVRKIADANDWNAKQIECGRRTPEEARLGSLCRLGVEGAQPSFLVWGDSHAKAMMMVMNEVATQHGVAGLQSAKGACPPLLDINLPRVKAARGCTEYNDGIRHLIERSNLDTVFLVGFWNGYGLNRDKNLIRHVDSSYDHMPSTQIFALQFRKTVEWLESMGIQVVVVEEPPYPRAYRPEQAAFARWQGRAPLAVGSDLIDYDGSTVEEYNLRNQRMHDLLAELDGVPIRIVEQVPSLCPDGHRCPAITDGRSNFKDSNHLSNHGARQLTGALSPVFEDIRRRTSASGSQVP